MVEMPNPAQSFNKYPHQLSGGQRQRAMIAQSISCDPLLLIADEPTTALDVTVQAEVLDLLRNLHKRLDSAIILITHDMGVVADLADRIMVMKEGVVVESGTVDEIFHAPKHPYTQQLLAAVPHLGLGVLETSPAIPDVVVARGGASRRSRRSVSGPARQRTRSSRRARRCSRSRTSRSTTPSAAASRRSAPPSTSTSRSTRARSSGSSGSRARARRRSGARRSACCRSRRASSTTVGSDISDASAEGPASRSAASTGIVFQDPASSLNPRMPIGQSIGEPMLLAGVAKGQEPRQARRGAAGPGRAAAVVPQPLPARAVRRSAAARRHRPRPGTRSRAAGRRRADLGARRVGPGAIPRPAAGAAARAAVRLPLHQPRPRRRRHPGPSHRGDAPREAGGGRHDGTRSCVARRTPTRSASSPRFRCRIPKSSVCAARRVRRSSPRAWRADASAERRHTGAA